MFGFLDRKDGLAVRHQNGDLTYGEFNLLLALMAERLDAFGLTPGDRVAAILPNSLELLASYYACLLRGLVIVPINERLTQREARTILNHSRPQLLVTTPGLAGRYADAENACSLSFLALEAVHKWLDRVPPGGSRLTRSPWPPSHPAVLFYTSGSTGAPKGALYTHRTLIENCRVFGNGLGVTSADHSVLCHCMASNFMFSQVTVPFLHVGGTVEIVDFGSVEQTLQAIEGGATFLSLIPWFGFQLIEAARERSPIPNRLRISEVGGDRVPLSYFRRFEEAFGLLPREHVGMTEANTYTVNPLLEEDLRLGSVGTALPEVEVEIRDASRHKQPPGVEGEVWVKTPGRMEEYWGDPEGTRETISEDWVATGDAGYLDEDGYLWLSGRIKHIIICDGDNIHPKEVEQEIAEHPLVERACVFGLPHPRRGEAVAAAVILKDPGDTLSVAELGAYLEDKLTEVKIPKDLLVLESFPEMAGGKLDRAAMAEALRGRRAAQ